MATESGTDRSVGLGYLFTILALLGALAMAALGYQTALAHGDAGGAQALSGVAFGVAVLAGTVGIVALHVYAD